MINGKKLYKIAIFGVLFAVFFVTLSGSIDSIDTVTHISLAKKIVLEKSIYFTREENAKLHMPLTQNAKDKKFYPVYNPGFSLLQIPGVILSIAIHRLTATPIPNFPYEIDFIIPLYTSFLNAFIGAILGVVMFKLFLLVSRQSKLNKVFAGFTILFILATNLFVQAHHVFPHLLFSLLYLVSFYFLIKHTNSKERKHIILFSFFFLLTALSYNATFVLVIPSFFVYLGVTFLFDRNKVGLRKLLVYFLVFLLALMPAFIAQLAWNYLRFSNLFSTGYLEYGIKIYTFHLQEVLRRLYGLTFSPSKGLFIYNPLLLITFLTSGIIFRNFFLSRKKLSYRLTIALNLSFVAVFITYLLNYSLVEFWHGDSAYGPRYLTPVITLGVVILLVNLAHLMKKFNLLIALGLSVSVVVGIWAQIPGILIPHFVFLNISPPFCREYSHRYFNWRCSPIVVGWKDLVNRRVSFTLSAIEKDEFNTYFISEISFPFPLFGTGYYPWNLKLPTVIYFSVPQETSRDVRIDMLIAKDWGGDRVVYKEATYGFYLNEKFLLEKITVKNSQWIWVRLKLPKKELVEGENRLNIKMIDFISIRKREDKLTPPDMVVLEFRINGKRVNMRNLRTLHPDPLFNKFSQWNTGKYNISREVYQNIYNEFLDIFWLKMAIYKNVISL